jgi:hypothetical protein
MFIYFVPLKCLLEESELECGFTDALFVDDDDDDVGDDEV